MPNKLEKLAKLIRYYILLSTTSAGSGHPTSSLSAVELMTTLFFRYLRYDPKNPKHPGNDRIIFSKGHATPLFYSLFAAAGELSEDKLKDYRSFESELEGHPTMRFAHTLAPTGSLGQGLSIGVGTSLNAEYLGQVPYRTFVLLGDGEIAEGQVWEAAQLASHYRLGSLIGILDVNRLGQCGETMLGNAVYEYEERLTDFGWRCVVVEDGHDIEEISRAFDTVLDDWGRVAAPKMIIANTVKGKGISFLEDEENWHGKALNKEQFHDAVKELGDIDKNSIGQIINPPDIKPVSAISDEEVSEPLLFDSETATRKAYGHSIARLGGSKKDIICLDAEVKNSTYAEIFFEKYPERSFEMFIAEQNMVSVALGLATTGQVPFASTFAAFWSRAHDQIRMASYSGRHIVFVGSHSGVSIGQDGPSQMGLSDIALFRSLFNSVVLYPSDAYATMKLTELAHRALGLVYLRTTRGETPLLYNQDDQFVVGGSKVLRQSDGDKVTIIAAGITIFEALKAYDQLEQDGVKARVIDAYSIKPIDQETLTKAAKETGIVVTVEDHRPEGGLGDAVLDALSLVRDVAVYKLAVNKVPRSGKPGELLAYEEIDAVAIASLVKRIIL